MSRRCTSGIRAKGKFPFRGFYNPPRPPLIVDASFGINYEQWAPRTEARSRGQSGWILPSNQCDPSSHLETRAKEESAPKQVLKNDDGHKILWHFGLESAILLYGNC